MKIPKRLRQLKNLWFGAKRHARPIEPASNAKAPWVHRLSRASAPSLLLGYLEGFDDHGRLYGWKFTTDDAARPFSVQGGEERVTLRADISRADLASAGHPDARGFLIAFPALAPLLAEVLRGHPLNIVDDQGEILGDAGLWVALPLAVRARLLRLWLVDCFRVLLDGSGEDIAIVAALASDIGRRPEILAGGDTTSALDDTLKAIQDLCAALSGGERAFSGNLSVARDFCASLAVQNPGWANATMGFEVALQVEDFLAALRHEWRQNLARSGANMTSPMTPALPLKSKTPETLLGPPLYPDHYHRLAWEGWVRGALDSGLGLAFSLGETVGLSDSLLERVSHLASVVAVVYRDAGIVAKSERLLRIAGEASTRRLGRPQVEARALKRLGHFAETFGLERTQSGEHPPGNAAEVLSALTSVLGQATQVQLPLTAEECMHWRHLLAPFPVAAGSDDLLQKTLASYLTFAGRTLMHPHGLGVRGAQNVRAFRLELIQGIRQLLHIAAPVGLEGANTTDRHARKILMIGSRDIPQVRLYRQVQKLEAVAAAKGFADEGEVTHIDTWSELDSPRLQQHLAGCRLLIVCRLPANLPLLRLLHAARAAGIPVFYDIDDLIFDGENFPPPYASYARSISRSDHRRMAEDTILWLEAMRASDLLIVSTPTLARRVAELLGPEKRVLVEPNCAPAALMNLASRQARNDWFPGKTTHLVYGTGTRAHKQILLEWIFPVISDLLTAHETLSVTLVGWMNDLPASLLQHPRVKVLPFTGYEEYLEVLATADISLAPLEESLATDAKSALKWMEAAFLGAACVVSPTATYREILEPDVDVFFAGTQEEWRSQLGRLVESGRMRRRVAMAAATKARRLFSPFRAREFWTARLTELGSDIGVSSEPHARKSDAVRLLVVNLYFWPQAAGGATRVVEEQVQGLMERYPGKYDITVLCADRHDGSGGVDFTTWQYGVRVVRLHARHKVWSDFLDEDVRDFMASWMRSESFDLVHVHALQVLTASVVRAARDAQIPCFITLHDAWWLSEYQFLTGPYGEAVDPADWMSAVRATFPAGDGATVESRQMREALEGLLGELYENGKAQQLSGQAITTASSARSPSLPDLGNLRDHRRTLDRRLENSVPVEEERIRIYSAYVRRRDLQQMLSEASGVFAVSESFASLYRAALGEGGGAKVRVDTLVNAWTSYASVPAATDQSKPMHCAFIGGWSVHKGAATLREAFARLHTRDVCLTIIDYGLARDEEYMVDWHETPVRFRGPLALEEMGAFYATVDVLLAPSIWPESFGLVTREALSAGVWVIATNAGALAEPVETGINGAVVAVRDAEALAGALDFAASSEGAAARKVWRAGARKLADSAPVGNPAERLHQCYLSEL